MARRLRYLEPGGLVEVTMRTLQSMFLLQPTPAACEIILGVLGRAQHLYGLEIHAFVFLSNHYHLLCSPRHARQLARAMCYINSNLARELGRLYGWRDRFWGRRYQAIPISSEPAAQLGRLLYLLAHGCKEGFVLTPGDWPGVNCIAALLEGTALTGWWYDRSREYEARRQGLEFGPKDFATAYDVTLSPLPCWRHLDPAIVRSNVRELVHRIEHDTVEGHHRRGTSPRGVAVLERQRPRDRPARSKRSPAPLIHAASRTARLKFLEAYRAFVAAYRAAADLLRRGTGHLAFPQYAFPPPLPFVDRAASAVT